MITVREEWANAETDADKVAWFDTWAPLLLETFQNPIWLDGHTHGKREIVDQMELVMHGEEPDDMHPLVAVFQEALETLQNQLKVVSFVIHGEKDMEYDITEMRKQAAIAMASSLAKHINLDTEETDDELILHFNLVLMDED